MLLNELYLCINKIMTAVVTKLSMYYIHDKIIGKYFFRCESITDLNVDKTKHTSQQQSSISVFSHGENTYNLITVFTTKPRIYVNGSKEF